jgi:glycosyltransferase involved in cell wall biosynthesis
MKVLIVSPTFGGYGGIEAFVLALATYSLKYSSTLVTVCFKKAKGYCLSPLLGANIKNEKFDTIYASKASLTLLLAIARSDIVHCQNPCIDVAVIAKLLGKPLVLTIHNYRNDRFSLWEFSRTIAFLLADRRWYNSSFVWSTWEKKRKYLTSERLPVVSRLPSGCIPIEHRKGFVFVSRWIANKGLDVLIKAYAFAKINRYQWPLVLIGDGPIRDSIVHMIDDLGIDGVHIVGSVPDHVRDFHIKQSRWMVTPPHTNEDMGLTPIEARNVSIPCIITRDGGLPEAAGSFSIICEPADVGSLQNALEMAASMSDSEYAYYSVNTKRELDETIPPLSVYFDRYTDILSKP